MSCNFDSAHTSYVITDRSEFQGIACLAIIGVASVIYWIANHAYTLGRDAREIELRREHKKHMKELEKQYKKERRDQ